MTPPIAYFQPEYFIDGNATIHLRGCVRSLANGPFSHYSPHQSRRNPSTIPSSMISKTTGTLAAGDNPFNLPAFLTPAQTITYALPVGGTYLAQRLVVTTHVLEQPTQPHPPPPPPTPHNSTDIQNNGQVIINGAVGTGTVFWLDRIIYSTAATGTDGWTAAGSYGSSQSGTQVGSWQQPSYRAIGMSRQWGKRAILTSRSSTRRHGLPPRPGLL